LKTGILFSSNAPALIDSIEHLKKYDELYFSSTFRINNDQYNYPLVGLVHIKNQNVKYCVKIKKIIPFSKFYLTDYADKIIPLKWIKIWKQRTDSELEGWNCILILTKIIKFDRDTLKIKKLNGNFVQHPPQNYTKIQVPSEISF